VLRVLTVSFARPRTFGNNHFDFTHGRSLHGRLEPRLLWQAFDARRPRGWFEQNEVETANYCNDDKSMDGASTTWAKSMVQAFEIIGRPWPKGPELKVLFEELGVSMYKSKS
jgi:hypothetical protein